MIDEGGAVVLPLTGGSPLARRARHTLYFLCSLVGAMLLLLGIMAIVRGGDDWWLYLLGAGLSFVCLLLPGERVKPDAGRPDA